MIVHCIYAAVISVRNRIGLYLDINKTRSCSPFSKLLISDATQFQRSAVCTFELCPHLRNYE